MDPVRVFSEIFVLTIVKVNGIRIVPRESASLESFLDHSAAPTGHQQVDEEHHHHQGCEWGRERFITGLKSYTDGHTRPLTQIQIHNHMQHYQK